MEKTMKRIIITFALLLILTPAAFAASHEMTKTVGDLTVALSFMGGHADMGDNHLSITITDPAGNSIPDARVKVEYGMPPMKNMTSMDYRARAKYMDGAYMANANFSMDGSWYIKVNVLRPGQELQKVEFKITIKKGSAPKSHGH